MPVAAAVSLLILQHPREQREPKGTARVLHLALTGSRLLVGDSWPTPPPPGSATAPSPARRDLLLYPTTPMDAALPPPPPLEADWLAQPGQLRLVVIDDTWRKSRRMLYGSPWLQGLPRLALADPPPSRYRIRRARGSQQRSTFEAVLLALATLAPTDAASLTPLWAVFEAFVDRLDRQGTGADQSPD